MGGKSGGSEGPTAAEIKANDDRLRAQWESDRVAYDAKRDGEEAAARGIKEQERRDSLWDTATSDYDKVYDNYKKQFDIDAELSSRQGIFGATGANVLKGDENQNEVAQAEGKGKFGYTGSQEEIDALNSEMDRLQGIEFDTGGKVGSQLKGETMAKFERKPKEKGREGLTAGSDEEFKYSKTLGGI